MYVIRFNGMTCNGKYSRFSWVRLCLCTDGGCMLCLLFVFFPCACCVGPSHSHPCVRQTLEDCTSPQGSVRNRSCRDSWYSEKEELFPLRARHRREDSLDSLNSLGSRTYSTSSDATLKGSSEGKTLQSFKSLLCALTWLRQSKMSSCMKSDVWSLILSFWTKIKTLKWNKLWSATENKNFNWAAV